MFENQFKNEEEKKYFTEYLMKYEMLAENFDEIKTINLLSVDDEDRFLKKKLQEIENLKFSIKTLKAKKASFNPKKIMEIENEIFGNNDVPSRQEVIENLIPYIKEEIKKGTRLNQIMRHTLGLFHGQTGASYWKRYLSENMCVRDADVQKINHIMDKIKYNNVETRVG